MLSAIWNRLFTAKALFFTLGVVLIFILCVRPAYDPDMGWHLKDGEYLLANNWHVPKTDIYSHTMPDFPFMMHEWITDIGMFAIYGNYGVPALSGVFALITAGAFILAGMAVSARKEYQIIAGIIGCIASINIIGVRPQMITLLLLAFLMLLLYRFRNHPQSLLIYLLPPLFLAWANLHGGFASGLVVLGLFTGLELAKKLFSMVYFKFRKKTLDIEQLAWKHWLKLLFLTAGSALATLVNPYGWRIYLEIINTITDSYLKSHISEWIPVSLANAQTPRLLTYIGLLAVLSLFSWRKMDITHMGISAVFAWFAFSSWRNVPIFIIISIPLWVRIAQGLAGETLSAVVRKKYVLALFLFAAILLGFQNKNNFRLAFSDANFQQALRFNYPYDAVQYLKHNPAEGKMFNDYNWGGFLIWQYPEQKVFIDGRMPSWRQNGQFVFEENQKVSMAEEGFRGILDKYGINWIFVPKNSVLSLVLAGDGWRVHYQDSIAVILTKP